MREARTKAVLAGYEEVVQSGRPRKLAARDICFDVLRLRYDPDYEDTNQPNGELTADILTVSGQVGAFCTEMQSRSLTLGAHLKSYSSQRAVPSKVHEVRGGHRND